MREEGGAGQSVREVLKGCRLVCTLAAHLLVSC